MKVNHHCNKSKIFIVGRILNIFIVGAQRDGRFALIFLSIGGCSHKVIIVSSFVANKTFPFRFFFSLFVLTESQKVKSTNDSFIIIASGSTSTSPAYRKMRN